MGQELSFYLGGWMTNIAGVSDKYFDSKRKISAKMIPSKSSIYGLWYTGDRQGL